MFTEEVHLPYWVTKQLDDAQIDEPVEFIEINSQTPQQEVYHGEEN